MEKILKQITSELINYDFKLSLSTNINIESYKNSIKLLILKYLPDIDNYIKIINNDIYCNDSNLLQLIPFVYIVKENFYYNLYINGECKQQIMFKNITVPGNVYGYDLIITLDNVQTETIDIVIQDA